MFYIDVIKHCDHKQPVDEIVYSILSMEYFHIPYHLRESGQELKART